MFYKVPNYEFAEVSEDGKIRSSLTGSLYSPYTDKDGYLRCKVWDGQKQRGIYVHRAVALVFVENPHQKPYVNHIDSNRQNNLPENLEWVTAKENSEHGVNAGNFPVGEDAFHSVYSSEQVHKVCKLLSENKSCVETSKLTGVSLSVVGSIKRRITWKEISDLYDIPQIKEKVTEEVAIKIVDLLNQGLSVTQVVSELNHSRVNRNTVGNIKNGKTFKHLKVTFNDQP